MQPTILVIEDDPTIVAVLDEFLTDEGYRVISLGSGQALLTYLTQHIPQLILTDVNLPDMDGSRIGSLLADNPVTSTIPILVMSGHTEKDLSLDDSRTTFIAKPFSLDLLLTMIHRALTPIT